jgi:hypothetical protein
VNRLLRFRLAAFPLLATLSARADNWIQNGDFSGGTDHWYGEAKFPADFAPPDPFTKADPLTSTGMSLPLKDGEWLKEFQDFKAKGTDAALKITFIVSPNLSFGNKGEDLANVPGRIGWDHWSQFAAPPDVFVLMISQLEQGHCYYAFVKPDPKNGGEQSYSLKLPGMSAWDPLTLAFAVPPGTGTVVIKKVECFGPDERQ